MASDQVAKVLEILDEVQKLADFSGFFTFSSEKAHINKAIDFKLRSLSDYQIECTEGQHMQIVYQLNGMRENHPLKLNRISKDVISKLIDQQLNLLVQQANTIKKSSNKESHKIAAVEKVWRLENFQYDGNGIITGDLTMRLDKGRQQYELWIGECDTQMAPSGLFIPLNAISNISHYDSEVEVVLKSQTIMTFGMKNDDIDAAENLTAEMNEERGRIGSM